MQEPTIGRIVRYRASREDASTWNMRCDGASIKTGDMLAAIVVHVWELGQKVSLRVFRDAKTDGWKPEVKFAPAGDRIPGTWHWPEPARVAQPQPEAKCAALTT